MNAVVLLGPPGAGKGTVSEVLVGKGYTHVSTGDLLREQIRLETTLGLEAKQRMDQGKFVPDDVVVGMIRDLLQSSDANANFLFDGFPRTLVQAEKLDELIEALSGTLEEVVLLQCPDEVIVERLSGRRTCSKCGMVYHIKYNPAVQEGKCDIEGCELMQRPDDNSETIKKRLDVYKEQTAPLITYYEAKGLIHPIDAAKSIAEVRLAVLARIG
ncbi:adenylate kinase [Pontiella sulfatireligans]|uniref:Adenylate kinase n=1 Tax=Pontiella sulfatireligans TaxID=2750658 RepID=A0A6C2UJX1_9BACT|nr:adenylate kinase [Pontiella sulfatireligans]VGO20532.1 Adenylate kinase [Pontiella sulfatireligans]